MRTAAAACVLGLLVACTAADPVTQDGPVTSVVDDAQPTAAPPDDLLHVEPRGDDGGSGTADDPFGSLQTALEQLRAGDELLVAGGTYVEDVQVEASAGTAQEPVRVRAAPGERPLLRGLLWLEEPTWWHLSGLDVTWHDGEDDEHLVKITDGTDWVLSDAEIWGAQSYAGVLVSGEPARFALRRLHVHDTQETNGTNEDHLVYLNSGDGGGVVEHCLLVGSPNGRAIKIGPAESDGDDVANLVIRYNTMVDNLGPSNVQLAWDSEDNEVYGNIMVGSGDGRPNVTTYDLDGGDNVVRHNVGWKSTGVLEQGVDGLEDGGGNLLRDPGLTGSDDEEPYAPTERWARDYGHLADGGPAGGATPTAEPRPTTTPSPRR